MELTGLPAAQALSERLRPEIEALRARGVTPRLAVVRVGARPDDLSYGKAIARRFAGAGCEVKNVVLPEDCGQSALIHAVALLDGDRAIHGILVLRPLPPEIDASRVAALISPEKDVDGMNPASLGRILLGEGNAFAPCTAEAVVALLDHYGISLTGKRVTIVGRSAVVGRPLMALLLARDATVSVCHTKTADVACACREADILVACAGRPGLVTAQHVGALCTIIDVGVSVVEGRLAGDAAADARAKALNFSPVPGGVGALTGAVLLAHTVRAAGRAV